MPTTSPPPQKLVQLLGFEGEFLQRILNRKCKNVTNFTWHKINTAEDPETLIALAREKHDVPDDQAACLQAAVKMIEARKI